MILPIFVATKNITNLLKLNNLHFQFDNLFISNAQKIIPETTKIAIYKFLLEYKDSAETLKLYTKELERLYLWCHNINIDLLKINREHIIKYQMFLKNPEPKDLWCGNKVAKLLNNNLINPAWRPYYKNLSPTSIKKILKIIESFFNYLVQIQVLPGNPLAIKARRNRDHHVCKIIERYLELDEINFTLKILSEYAATNSQHNFLVIRAKYIILLLFYTGMRISEAAKHTMGNFLQRENNWFLGIVGKGKKYREIPIPDELLDILSDFRQQIGLSYLPEFKESTPLIPHLSLKQCLTARRIDQILKWAFNIAAEGLKITHPHKASKLELASAHWLRHSYVTYLLNNGAPLKVAQENAGHSDISTTMLYRHVNQVDRHKATRNLSLKHKTTDEDET